MDRTKEEKNSMQVQELEISALRSDNDEPRKLALLILFQLSCPLEFILQLEIKTHAKNNAEISDAADVNKNYFWSFYRIGWLQLFKFISFYQKLHPIQEYYWIFKLNFLIFDPKFMN